MIFDNKFYVELNKLDDFRENINWSKFFELIFKIERLGEKREIALHREIAKTKTVDNNIVRSFEKLDSEKDKFASLTNTQVQYDAVSNCVCFVKEYFSTLILD